MLTYSKQQSPLEANRFSASQEIPHIYGTRKFITAFTSTRHLSISRFSSNQSMPPHPTSWISILILSSHLRLGLPSGLFHSGIPTKTLYMPPLALILATCPAHLIHLHFITRTIVGEGYRSLSASLCSFLHSPVTTLQLIEIIYIYWCFKSYIQKCLCAQKHVNARELIMAIT